MMPPRTSHASLMLSSKLLGRRTGLSPQSVTSVSVLTFWTIQPLGFPVIPNLIAYSAPPHVVSTVALNQTVRKNANWGRDCALLREISCGEELPDGSMMRIGAFVL